ncbi:MAG: VOC family protein [Cyanobacteria bacterium P01_G01_bin.19]
MSVNKIPDGYNSVAPYLIVPDAEEAIEFYTKAFGASENMRLNMPDGSIGHAEIRIGNSIIMLSSANPDMGFHSPEQYGGSPVSIFLYVEDVDDFTSQATSAGATIKQAPLDMFWGDRMAKLKDPFGYEWSVATHIEDVSLEESQRRLYEQYSAAVS